MTIRLGTNVQSLQAQRRLGQATDRTGEFYRRLSTGQRITKASDDAAGLAIAESLTSKSRVFSRSVQNISDGISALTIADSALEALTQITTRIQELAEQGASGSYSPTQRSALDKEAQSLRNEFLRIVQSTSFNGRNLLDGSTQGLLIQAGYGVDGIISSSVGGAIGTGSFNAAANLAVVGTPFGIATGDFNGDGNQDVVTANSSGNTVATFLGNGTGTFQSQATMVVGSSPFSVTTSDFNGDGVLDLATSNYNSSNISVLIGNGSGGFVSAGNVALGGNPFAVASGDFNGDGRADMVAANGTNGLSVLFGNGNGTFQASVSVSAGVDLQSIAVADFNGDGRADIVAADYGTASAVVLLGNGAGGFQSPASFAAGGGDTSVVTTGDFNGDGFIDVVTGNSDNLSTGVLFGDGSGGFSSPTLLAGGGRAATVTDLNGDGFLDIVASGSSVTNIHLGDGTGNFSSTFLFQNTSSLGSGDFNNDGVPDLVGVDGISSAWSRLAQTKDGLQPLLAVSLRTQADSRQALSLISKKLELLSAQRGVIGAAQSRLLSGSRAIASQRDEFIAASSRIRDADFASEAANLSRVQITQSAATAMMAQANQQPALALKLLRGA